MTVDVEHLVESADRRTMTRLLKIIFHKQNFNIAVKDHAQSSFDIDLIEGVDLAKIVFLSINIAAPFRVTS